MRHYIIDSGIGARPLPSNCHLLTGEDMYNLQLISVPREIGLAYEISQIGNKGASVSTLSLNRNVIFLHTFMLQKYKQPRPCIITYMTRVII